MRDVSIEQRYRLVFPVPHAQSAIAVGALAVGMLKD